MSDNETLVIRLQQREQNSAPTSTSHEKPSTYEPPHAPDFGKQSTTHEKENASLGSQILPPRLVMSRCLVSFFRGYGFFHSFLPEAHSMNLYQALYSPSYDKSTPSAPTISSVEFGFLLLTAAVGAIYVENSDTPAREIREELFRTGKYHLDVAMKNMEKTGAVKDDGGQDRQLEHTEDETVMLKITALATVALYMIFQKEILARKYIEQAIHLAKSKGLAMINSLPKATGVMEGGETLEPRTGGEWETWRRIWRSLVFLDGWLSASVGYRPVINSVDNYDPWNFSEKGLHAEMAKLGVLMSAITRDICAPETFEMGQVQEYSRQLKTWHDNLPEYLTLTKALDFKSDSAQRTSILLTHCAYLGSLILLTRRILVAQTKSLRGEMQQTVIGDTGHDMVKLSHDCIYAARQLATVVGIFYMEGRLMRRCWLGIQSAFTSCLIIFLELAVLRRQYNLRPESTDSELVSRCLYALEYCASVDVAAKSFLNTLVQIRDILFANTPDLQDVFPVTQFNSPRSPSYPTMVTGSREPISPIKPPRVFTSANPDEVRSHSAPNVPTSYPAATTSQMFRGQEEFGDDDQNSEKTPQTNRRDDQSIESLLIHIMNCLESPYGGDHSIVNESSSNIGSFPVNWRFLNPNPPKIHMHLAGPAEPPQLSPRASGHPNTSQTQGSSQHAFFSPPDYHPSISSSVAAMHNTNISSNQEHRKSFTSPGGPLPDLRIGNGDDLPFNSLDEYKEFLRRIA